MVNMTAKEACQICRDKRQRIPELEKIILDSNDSSEIYNYVCFVVRDVFPEGETILATDTYWSVAYAIHFLKAPFEIAHSKIFERSEYNQIMVNKYKGFLDDIGYNYSEWII
jgi:hypothetical protein